MTTDITMLTGDRPTGPLHLGHYAGSLVERVRMQDIEARRFIMIADAQAYTDNIGDTAKVRDAIPMLVADYIASGIDPEKSTIFLQSAVPEIVELMQIFMNITTLARTLRNPTVGEEIKQRGFEKSLPLGFAAYPVAQSADILGFRATHVPVGSDQLPMIELASETAARINRMAGADVLVIPQVVLTSTTRLPGIDGHAKASKSLNNAIYLSDAQDEVKRKVMQMFTDPGHLRVTDPGKVEGNAVFAYLDAFDADKEKIAHLKDRYREGGLGDVTIKKELIGVLEGLLQPMRDRRPDPVADREICLDVLRRGTASAREVVSQVLADVRRALGMFSL
ncbi:tryptophan--tRNA ligase [Agrobacterium rubi]|nr:tryptophan--tRNA ligase [Agrobacterium rubi]NTF24432.1 tryptophan--tRNA ligase [Agrobacterium rubi]